MQPFRSLRSSLRVIGALLVLLAVAPAAWAADDEEAVRVFRQLKSSVVSLKNVEGSGTGVLVGADGLVLTNAHVISSPLPYSLTVDVDEGAGKTRSVTFKRVQVVGYHQRLDLALLRIDAKELRDSKVTLKTAEIVNAKAEPGQRVYVIGDPLAGGSRVLAKSITAGMISAVDREVDGERYYQTDAAINPGNSGGPMCDRAGKVLGIITFRFSDGQGIGFAIPMHDVDLKKFVNVTDRKTNPARADALMREADRFSDAAVKAQRRDGPESYLAIYYNSCAASCYRQALSYDPANPALHYAVGMLLRTLDEDEVAAGYLARCCLLQPWDTGGDQYRELGLALAKQKKLDQAHAAWTEGLSKHPYHSKIWEDLAIFYITTARHVEAAEASSIALLISERDTRRAVMEKVLADAKAGVKQSSSAELEKRITPTELVAKLDALLIASNKGRKARQEYMNKPFADLIAEMGGPSIPGIAARIPQTPQERLPELARFVPPPPGTEAAPKPEPANPAVPVSPAVTTPKPPAVATGKPTAKPPGDDWIGGDTAKTPAAPTTDSKGVPQPVASERRLAKQAKTVVDAEDTELDVKDVVGFEWSTDTKSGFALQGDGVVRKFSVPELVEQRTLSIGSKAASFARCNLGLVVALPELQEVWLLDEDLAVKKKAAAGGLSRMVASPALPMVYVAAGPDRLIVLDMATGRVAGEVTGRDLGNQRGAAKEANFVRFNLFAISPDGQHLFVEGFECLHRLRITGSKLFHEQVGPRIGQNPQAVIVSPDSKYVAMPSGGGNSPIDGKRSPYSTYVFRVSDLKTPVMTIASGAYPRTLGFDVAARSLYAQNHDKSLIVFAPTGVRGKEYTFASRGDDAHRFYIHPEGKKLFVQIGGGLHWITLP